MLQLMLSQTATLDNGKFLAARGRRTAPKLIPKPFRLPYRYVAKTVVFWYLVYRIVLRSWRHLRIYGVTPTLYQGYTELTRVSKRCQDELMFK